MQMSNTVDKECDLSILNDYKFYFMNGIDDNLLFSIQNLI